MSTVRSWFLLGMMVVGLTSFGCSVETTGDADASSGGMAGATGGSGGSANAGSGGSANAGSGGSSSAGSGGSANAGSGGGTSSDPFASARQLCVDLTNGYRDKVGVPHLKRRADKEACVDTQCKSDSETGKDHGAFRKCGEMAQNECPGWPGSNPEASLKKCLQAMFNEGPGEPYSAHGHYINMTSTKYKSLACGFYKTPKGSLWIIQDFYP